MLGGGGEAVPFIMRSLWTSLTWALSLVIYLC
jgi:hypothetical protein